MLDLTAGLLWHVIVAPGLLDSALSQFLRLAILAELALQGRLAPAAGVHRHTKGLQLWVREEPPHSDAASPAWLPSVPSGPGDILHEALRIMLHAARTAEEVEEQAANVLKAVGLVEVRAISVSECRSRAAAGVTGI
jgi:hypothetical protein